MYSLACNWFLCWLVVEKAVHIAFLHCFLQLRQLQNCRCLLIESYARKMCLSHLIHSACRRFRTASAFFLTSRVKSVWWDLWLRCHQWLVPGRLKIYFLLPISWDSLRSDSRSFWKCYNFWLSGGAQSTSCYSLLEEQADSRYFIPATMDCSIVFPRLPSPDYDENLWRILP